MLCMWPCPCYSVEIVRKNGTKDSLKTQELAEKKNNQKPKNRNKEKMLWTNNKIDVWLRITWEHKALDGSCWGWLAYLYIFWSEIGITHKATGVKLQRHTLNFPRKSVGATSCMRRNDPAGEKTALGYERDEDWWRWRELEWTVVQKNGDKCRRTRQRLSGYYRAH